MGRSAEVDNAIRRAWALVEAGDLDGALERFDEATALAPGDASIPLERGVALFKAERLEGARDAFARARDIAPRDRIATANLAKVTLLLGEDAEGLYDELLAHGPGEGRSGVKLLLGRAAARLRKGDSPGALEDAEAALVLDRRSPEAHTWRGRALAAAERHEEALEALETALVIRQGDHEALLARGRSLEALDRVEPAMEAYAEAARARPKDTVAPLALGALFLESARYQEALAVAERTILRDQRCAGAWGLKAHAQRGLGADASAALCRGMEAFLEGRHEAAIEALDEAVERDSGYAEAWSNKGVVYRAMGRNEDAVDAYRRALDLDPGALTIWNNLGMLLWFRLGRVDEGLACFRELVRRDPPRWFKLPDDVKARISPP